MAEEEQVNSGISHLISESLGVIARDELDDGDDCLGADGSNNARVELVEAENSPSLDLYSVVEPLNPSYQDLEANSDVLCKSESPFRDSDHQLLSSHEDLELMANTNSSMNSEVQQKCSPGGPQVVAGSGVPPLLPSTVLPPPVTPGQAPPIPPPNINRFCMKHPNIEITLDGKELWDQFYQKGTEMIVNRSGRRMFPGFSASISGLKPKAKYTMKLDVVLADNHRFKFLNARWLAVGSSEPQSQYETYLHTDSPNTGSFWMRHGISFRKLKITNNKDKPGQNALLHSMHKYFLRLVIEEERKTALGEPKQPSRPILSIEFPETTFIAVTAYQNEEVTQLKISNNPFAKAFRENAADMDWETAQALYSSPGYMPQSAGMSHSGNYYHSAWGAQSPMLSPASLTPSIHHHSYQHQQHFPSHHHLHLHQQSLPSAAGMQYSPDSPMLTKVPHNISTTPGSGGYFQWPSFKTEATNITSSSYQQSQPGYGAMQPVLHEGSSSHNFQQSASLTQLPDFDSVFTSPMLSHTTYNNPS